jgi:predicted AlkP superfamily pyrophosphatase or phosphodiesterase
MMRKIALTVLWFGLLGQAHAAPWAMQKPKLVVVIVIDQFRADYISRFEHLFSSDGFMGLIKGGAYYPYGEYDLLQSMTCPGHATILTGAYPYQMGIPINSWYDQKLGRSVYCVEDDEAHIVGKNSPEGGVSPRNLVGDTVGDELKNADLLPSKSISIALKDRAAILLGGHRADLATWFDKDLGHWTTSLYYRKDLPEWIEKLNASSKFKGCAQEKPCGAAMTAEAVQSAIAGENLGQHKGVDILTISFSGHDFAGHKFGPNADEMKDVTLAEDKAIADIRKALISKVPGGAKNILFVLTGDHGVAAKPEYLKAAHIDSERVDDHALAKEINHALSEKFGAPAKGEWIPLVFEFNFFINEEAARQWKVEISRVEHEIKLMLLKNPGFVQVVTRSELLNHQGPPGMFGRHADKTFFNGRSGHVIAILRPFYVNEGKGDANHLTGYVYDRTVPIVLSGFGIKPGLYSEKAEVVDIAPTLSFLLGILPPALSEGRVLTEALTKM